MPSLITPADVNRHLQPPPKEIPVDPVPPEKQPVEEDEKVPLTRYKSIPRRAVAGVEPFAFSVNPSSDVSSRDDAMQRKASAMNAINVYDVQEFMQKMAAAGRWKVDNQDSVRGSKYFGSENAGEGVSVNQNFDYRGEGYGPAGKMNVTKRTTGLNYPTSNGKSTHVPLPPGRVAPVNYAEDYNPGLYY